MPRPQADVPQQVDSKTRYDTATARLGAHLRDGLNSTHALEAAIIASRTCLICNVKETALIKVVSNLNNDASCYSCLEAPHMMTASSCAGV